jgi:hypothetical protein
MLDIVTNFVEVVRIHNKTAAYVALQFENTWLSRYPKPKDVIHDQGEAFTGYEFLHRLHVTQHQRQDSDGEKFSSQLLMRADASGYWQYAPDSLNHGATSGGRSG